MSEINQNSEEENEIDSEFILSLCWDSGILSAVSFNTITLELHVRFYFDFIKTYCKIVAKHCQNYFFSCFR